MPICDGRLHMDSASEISSVGSFQRFAIGLKKILRRKLTSEEVQIVASDTMEKIKDWAISEKTLKKGTSALTALTRCSDDEKVKTLARTALSTGEMSQSTFAAYMAALSALATPVTLPVDELLIRVAQDGMKRCASSQAQSEVASTFFNAIAGNSKSGDETALAVMGGRLPAVTDAEGQSLGSEVVLDALLALKKEPLQNVLIGAIDEVLGKSCSERERAEVARLLVSEFANVAGDPALKTIAGAACNFSAEHRYKSEILSYRTLLSTIQAPIAAPLDRVLLSMARDAMKGWDDGSPQGRGDIALAYNSAIAKNSGDQLAKDLFSAAEKTGSSRDTDAMRAGALAAFDMVISLSPGEAPDLVFTDTARDAMKNASSDKGKALAAQPFVKALAPLMGDPQAKSILETAAGVSGLDKIEDYLPLYETVLSDIDVPSSDPTTMRLASKGVKILEKVSTEKDKALVARAFREGISQSTGDIRIIELLKTSADMGEKAYSLSTAFSLQSAFELIAAGNVSGPLEKLLSPVAHEAMKKWDASKQRQETKERGKTEVAKPFLGKLAELTPDPSAKHVIVIAKELPGLKQWESYASLYDSIFSIYEGLVGQSPDSALASAGASSMQKIKSEEDRLQVAKVFRDKISKITLDTDMKTLVETAGQFDKEKYFASAAFSLQSAFEAISTPGAPKPIENRLASVAAEAMKKWDGTSYKPDVILRGKGEVARPFVEKIAQIARDPAMRLLAEATSRIGSMEKWKSFVTLYDVVLPAIDACSGKSADGVLMSTATELVGKVESEQDRGIIAQAFNKRLLEITLEPDRRTILEAAGNLSDKTYYQSRAFAVQAAYEKMQKTPELEPLEKTLAQIGLEALKKWDTPAFKEDVKTRGKTEVARPYLLAIVKGLAEGETKKTLTALLEKPGRRSYSELASSYGKILKEIIDIYEMGDIVSEQKSSDGVSEEDNFVIIDGVKLEKHRGKAAGAGK